MKEKSTKKAKPATKTSLRAEYQRADLGQGVRGKYLEQVSQGTNLVLLSPDVAEAFPTPDAVNDALRGLLQIAKRATSSTKRAA